VRCAVSGGWRDGRVRKCEGRGGIAEVRWVAS